uniref:NADH-ubiquinone oxidoreductase chain 2 n=1 Tax=Athripsodes aterrimus TaxID=699862 RepID=A0A7D6W416_9NEOP|nr:NADH dehydrogenase subunit 2 [Athripsodes aterrimus]
MTNMKWMFFLMMIISSLLSISSSSWLNIWMGMEINVMSFIPLMLNSFNMKSSESILIYFLVQSISSMNLLFFILINNLNTTWFEFTNLLINNNMIINLILLMKMGAAPFYFWFPKIIKELTWMSAFILMTWQKIIPLMLIKFYFNKFIISFSIVLTVIIASFLGMNQTNMKLIMAFSSINHLGWMLSALMMSTNIWLIYFLNYSLLNYILCLTFNTLNIKSLMNILLSNFFKNYKLMLLINFLSLSGLPPFLGFFPKWLIIMNLILMKNYMIMLILIMTTLINLFFYLRITISSFTLTSMQLKWNIGFFKNQMNYFLILFLSFISTIFLILITLIMNFF